MSRKPSKLGICRPWTGDFSEGRSSVKPPGNLLFAIERGNRECRCRIAPLDLLLDHHRDRKEGGTMQQWGLASSGAAGACGWLHGRDPCGTLASHVSSSFSSRPAGPGSSYPAFYSLPSPLVPSSRWRTGISNGERLESMDGKKCSGKV
ncbi:hypothetical protein AXF42_Ash001420 [Apostasia shenzhenica]|uniref:Uncharacterized protein n=1 Tax=Apostasia shenzhenica TaxID=1088818 RepID=A0A2I0AUZ9_9ASPA|nr:hypothetical protein AXF42_Ash001420 [Apostasia shenzhenica]